MITLCKAIIKRDWKVTRLILSGSRISDEGLKNLTTAVTQSELYSLTLYDIGLQSQGLKHLCEALISYDCCSTSLNISDNRLGDDGSPVIVQINQFDHHREFLWKNRIKTLV